MTDKFDLIDLFSRRPSLSEQARDSLRAALTSYFPDVHLDPDVAVVTGQAENGEARTATLTACLQRFFASGQTPRWKSGADALVVDPAASLAPAPSGDMEALAILVDTVSLGLLDDFTGSLIAFWDRAGADGATPCTRLANALAQRRPENTDASVFEQQALAILDAQLADLQAIPSLGLNDFDEIERYVAKTTDILPWLSDAQDAAITRHLSRFEQVPDWLSRASSADRLDFSRRLAALAVVNARAAGRCWDDDVPPLLDYARKTLQDLMRGDHPDVTWLTLDDVTVHIDKVVAVPVPSAGQFIPIGSIEHQRMSVAHFALGNLCSVPSGTIVLSLRDGGPLPRWLTIDYLKQLVVRADIGRAYPTLVRQYLMTNPVEVSRRQRLFGDQLRVQLPLKALEQKLRGEGGLTDAGYRRVCSLFERSAAHAGSDTVLRPLAWVAQPGAVADDVCNQFVIGTSDTAVGPFVLYRPLAPMPLMEFAAWPELRAAIATTGELQGDALVWMTDHGRQRYANGGFDQPHIVRFGLGSDFAPIENPAPAQLAVANVDGDVLVALFNANARALVELADRESVSNAESRWAMIQRAGWLGLDLVMPFLSGAVGNALWLVQLMSAVDQVLVARKRAVGHPERQAWTALLLTVSMMLMHEGFVPRLRTPRAEVAEGEATRAGHGPTEAPETVDGESQATALTPLLDFSWSSVRHRLTPAQARDLERLKVTPEPDLGAPSAERDSEGLYLHDGQWHARLDSGVYRVAFKDEDVRVIDPRSSAIVGPRLRRTGGRWTLDLSLGLRGGGPKRNARQVALENAAKLKAVTEREAVLDQHQVVLFRRFVGWNKTCRGAKAQLPGTLYDLIETDLNELKAIVEERQRLQASLRPADRAPETTVAKDLQALVRRIAFYEGVLLQNLVKLARNQMDRLEAVSLSAVTQENVDGYVALFEDMLQIEERGTQWSGLRESLWQQLRDVPKVGEKIWHDEVLDLVRSNVFTQLDWRATRLWSLLELSFSKDVILSKQGSLELKSLRTDDRLHAAVSSQIELEKPNDYTLAEQIDVLESSLREYDRGILIAVCAQQSVPEAFEPVRFTRFLDEFGWIADRAEKRLSDLIRESTEPVARPVDYAPRVRQPRKRVFKTRAHRTLVGQLREGEPDMPGAVVDVTQSMGNTVIETYHLHENGEWVEVNTVAPAQPEKPVPVVALAELKRQATSLLERVEADIANARRQSKKADEPADMQDILTHKADRLTALAEKLTSAGAGDEAAQIQVSALRASASRLVEEGRTLRIAMIKAQPPTAGRLAWLAQEREVDIARFEGRKNMSGAKRNDFLQEYVIRDADQRVLWWAHFHYASENAAAEAFTAAHLKRPEQRFVGYKAQVKAAKESKDVIRVYRSAIGKEIAQRLFLSLAG
ncbi:dermonecrotic toxin domain-containing protein [Pseudomonas sp. SLFW]|uniref:dermonecrotic toxin domain-containing protein n=1 Tax=Pseudomonas sp. SLFW TaxID=2683259 RepID=UPI0014123F07|nr:DUF6543 domain-containing protein [Pseudomonas sp. SLFW]NBB09972.1 hypothetical protein [Pseudomonas sp. SLFW]